MKEKFFVPANSAQKGSFRDPQSCKLSRGSRAFQVSTKALVKCSGSKARALLPYDLAVELLALPLGIVRCVNNSFLSVAIADDENTELISALRFATGMNIRPLVIERELLESAIFAAYRGDAALLEQGLTALKKEQETDIVSIENNLVAFHPEHGEAAQFLSALIEYALAQNASDLHIVPRMEGSLLRLRLNGELLSHPAKSCSLKQHAQLISRIKILANLDTTQKSLPQDGSFVAPTGNKKANIRVSIMPSVYGEKAVLRFTGEEGSFLLSELGLHENTLFYLEELCHKADGAVLFCGPTGGGKTTTMYAVMDYLSKKNLNLVSVEDPVEVCLSGVSQTSINEKVGLNYATALRAILRQDPDVILLGEIRDQESAEIAIQASITGHLLLSTVHARNVFDVLLRLKALGLDYLSIAQGLRLIVCQRLVMCLCEHCKVFDLKNSNRLDLELYQASGCKKCDYSGFLGRALVEEFLHINDELAYDIQQERIAPQDIKKHISSKNYLDLKSSINRLLSQGLICVEDYERLF